jgi:hypothetical protein
MVTIKIGSSQGELEDLREDWLAEQLARRRADNQSVCLEVKIATDRLNMRLATTTCPAGGPTRAPTQAESACMTSGQDVALTSPTSVSAMLHDFCGFFGSPCKSLAWEDGPGSRAIRLVRLT